MARAGFTAKSLESLEPTEGKQASYPDKGDGRVNGLELRVTPKGRKVWSLRYRIADGTQRRMTLGVFPSVGLGDARKAAQKVIGAVADDKDPAREKRQAKAEAKAQPIKTFEHLAEAYLKACEAGKWKPKGKPQRARTIAGYRAQLDRYVLPTLGSERLENITKAKIRALLHEVMARKPERGPGETIGAQTNRAQAVISQCFEFAISEERMIYNPALGLSKTVSEKPRERTLTDSEMKKVWAALEDPSGLHLPPKAAGAKGVAVYVGRPMRIAVQLLALPLQRRGEVAGMRANEVNLEQATWLIPGDRMKGGRAHLVPLPPQAVVLVLEALELGLAGLTDEERAKAPADRPVFPSPRDATKSVKPDSLTHAMVNIAAALGIQDATPHDLRRTGSSAMTSERLSVSPFIRSKVLGHRGDTGGGAAVSMIHYDTNTYVAEKRRALEAWEGLLLEIVGDRAAPSV